MFITFEGIDGCGKSTQAGFLFDHLSRKYGTGKVLWTREPGGWAGSNSLREMLLSKNLEHPWTELFLFLADRCEHARKVIEPALEQGIPVICERYDDSTLAYQVWGRGLPLEKVKAAIQLGPHPSPDRTILIEVSAETALERILSRSGPDRYEREGAPFLERVREGYQSISSSNRERFVTINGEGKPGEVFDRLLAGMGESL